jgi:hypothetical protein
MTMKRNEEITNLAVTAAHEIQEGRERGNLNGIQLEQLAENIDYWVGRWNASGDFVWPAAIAEIAGLPVIRRHNPHRETP